MGEQLACERGGRPVFADLGFELAPGAMLILRGANGSGKSSLLRILATLLQPVAGRLVYDGNNVDDDPDAYRRRICFVGHQDALKGALSVSENLLFWADLHGGGGLNEALSTFAIEHLADTPVQHLSAGQKRRAALARLALGPAPIWLLDEPTVSLDEAGVGCLQNMIARHREGGGIVIAATHIELGVESTEVLELGS
jgi:heme exporter protein A